MGLNPQGKGEGRGNVINFSPRVPHQGGISVHRPIFRPNSPGVYLPGFTPECQFNPTCTVAPYRFNSGVPRPAFKKFPRKNFRKNFVPKNNGVAVPEIDLSKPWVTEEILNEENKKQKLLETWNESRNNEDWNVYKRQKLVVQTLYDKKRTEYAAIHPQEPALWEMTVKHHYCETCDKSFRTDDDLILHKAEHETCGREGCEFTAHPKIIAKHIKMQHASGLYKRIGKLYTEEDISKWIEERKKHYPTRKVIEEKKILEQEKFNRGERIKDDDSKFNKSFNKKNKRKKTFDRKTQRSNKSQKTRRNKKPVVVQCIEEETSSVRRGVVAFQGINGPSEPEAPAENFEKDIDISDDDWEMDCKVPRVEKPILNSSLGLLATLYDSDVENQNEDLQSEVKEENMSADEGSGPEEVKTVSSKNLLPEECSNEERNSLKKKQSTRKIARKRQNVPDDRPLEKRSLTLLEKLLKNEIRHERNVILQCVHYVVKNNFFKP